MSAPLLELKDLHRSFAQKRSLFGRPARSLAVAGVSLAVRKGETLGLVGESGCGKSTLGRLAVRLLKPDSGDVLLDGRSIFHRAGAADRDFQASLPARLQMVFQDPQSSLNPRLKIGYSIGEALACQGLPLPERRDRVAGLLRRVGLDPEHARRYPHEFSGGQRQRMALARALAPRPDLIVCDEPTSSLDASIQGQVLNLLSEFQEEYGLSYLFISHDLAVVSHMSDRVAVMYAGMILESGPTTQIFNQPAHPYTQALLEASTRKSAAPSPLRPHPATTHCPYYPRCPKAQEPCALNLPPLAKQTKDSVLRCFF